MRAVVQRVTEAAVAVEGSEIARIGLGALVLLGIGRDDDPPAARGLATRIAALRIFDDASGRMNRSVVEIGGAVLVVSQFTLWGDCRAGRRPSWSRALPAAEAEPIYREFVAILAAQGVPTGEGRFGATMQVSLVNDGPVTILLDSAGAF